MGDVASAVAWLRTQPAIDPNAIAVLGTGHGGWTAATAVQRRYADLRLSAAVDYHGLCTGPEEYSGLPFLALLGEVDDWGNPAAVCRAYAAQVPHGAPRSKSIHTQARTIRSIIRAPTRCIALVTSRSTTRRPRRTALPACKPFWSVRSGLARDTERNKHSVNLELYSEGPPWASI
jgi:hypothetical protein